MRSKTLRKRWFLTKHSERMALQWILVEVSWSYLKNSLSFSHAKSFLSGQFSISWKQEVIKLIEKKNRDKRLIKNWKPISLNNIDVKFISKVLAKVNKKYLPLFYILKSTAYVVKKIISEGGQLISAILEIASILKIKAFSAKGRYRRSFSFCWSLVFH